MKELFFTSQSRFNFDADKLLSMGVKRAYVAPVLSNNEYLKEPEFILHRLEELKVKADKAIKKGLEVYPFFITINHPEGNFQVPSKYRIQQNIDGSLRPEFICFRDKIRQAEMISFATKSAELGFERIMFDDDLRDAFCYCDEHINGFDGFKGKSRKEIERILNSVLTNPAEEQLREDWYKYKYHGMMDYAVELEKNVHKINPKFRIGICTSAKRCQDFSGRNPSDWIKNFSTENAPAFVRLCGECYDDSIWHLCQSTGWSQYMNACYSEDIEKVIEVTSVPSITYRSPGTVWFETEMLVAATANPQIHWAWPEEFERTGLCEFISQSKNKITSLSEKITNIPQSPLCVYIDSDLGAYTPTNISIPYGATHDPINAYNIISLLGLPVIVRPNIPKNQPSIICSSYISRKMVKNIDEYVSKGGIAILDVKSAQCYKTYGGQVLFEVHGPVSLNKYEVLRDKTKNEIIANCPPDSIYYLKAEDSIYSCQAFDINCKFSGYTTLAVNHGKGKLVILGYDLSRTGQVLLCSQWRNRIIDLIDFAGITMPAYWRGSICVQCFYYDDKVVLANYNSHEVEGELIIPGKTIKLYVKPFSLKVL
jgi:hypothetical protein